MNGPAFDTYIETQLAPLLEPGSIVILDNLSTHKSPKAAAALKARGCWFLFLPPYSPDLNPIELAFSKPKAHLRRIGARTYDDLIAAIGDICNLYLPSECGNFFSATGYNADKMQNALAEIVLTLEDRRVQEYPLPEQVSVHLG